MVYKDYALAVNIICAEIFKDVIEYSRVNYPKKTGVLWWSLYDMWPMLFNYSVVDCDGQRKLPYYWIRESQQDVALIDSIIFYLFILGNIIYYMGPSPARPGNVIGSAGPTTSSRMDKYTPALLDMGMAGIIGKGKRNQQVLDAIVRNESVYFAAVGGAGALLSKAIVQAEVIAYEDLGTEAIHKLEVKNFPVVVVVDSKGNNLYETAVKQYRKDF